MSHFLIRSSSDYYAIELLYKAVIRSVICHAVCGGEGVGGPVSKCVLTVSRLSCFDAIPDQVLFSFPSLTFCSSYDVRAPLFREQGSFI